MYQDIICFFFKKMGHSRPLFTLFSSFQYSQLTGNVELKILPMTGFEPRTSGSEATAQPTEPQPLPKTFLLDVNILNTKNYRLSRGRNAFPVKLEGDYFGVDPENSRTN